MGGGRKSPLLENGRHTGVAAKLIDHCVRVGNKEATVEAATVVYASVSLLEGTAMRLKSMVRSACRL